MVCTVCHQKEQSYYGLQCVSLEGGLIMVYTVCHQKEQSYYGLQCVSLEGAV